MTDAPDGRLVQPGIFRDLVTWPLVAVLLAATFAALPEALESGNIVSTLLVAIIVLGAATPWFVTLLLVASAGTMTWRARERRLGRVGRMVSRALHAAVVAGLLALALQLVPGEQRPSGIVQAGEELLSSFQAMRDAWLPLASAMFLGLWTALELRDRFARRAAMRAAADGTTARSHPA